MNSVLYINGLNGGAREQPWEMRELAAIEADGIHTEHVHLRWNRLAVEGTIDVLEERVSALAELGAVSIAGFSAGGSMAINVYDRVKENKAIDVYNIAGRLAKGTYGWFNPRHLRHAAHLRPISPDFNSYPGFYESVEWAERRVLPYLTKAERARITVLKPKNDLVVPLASMDVYGRTSQTLNARSHHRAGIQGLRAVHEIIKEKAAKTDSA